MTVLRPKSCDHARLWISLALDDELSEFEHRLLDAHLGRCAECRRYEVGVRAATATLRGEPLVASDRSVELPRPQPARGVMRLAASAAAAALVAAVGTTGFLALSGGNQRPRLEQLGRVHYSEAQDVRILRRPMMSLQRVKPQHVQSVHPNM